MRELRARTALVTGASHGIGTHIARALAAEQMQLVLAARSEAELEALAEQLRQAGCRVLVVPTDVGDRAALEALVEAAGREWGGVDLLVNNAGTMPVGAYHRFEAGELERFLQVNFASPLLLTRMVLPGMLAQGRGHIVNIASLAGKVAVADLDPYCAIKAGLTHLTAALRASYRGSGVSASAVCPGFVRETGVYHQVQQDTGVQTPLLLGSSPPGKVAAAVVRAVKRDQPEVLVNPLPVRPVLALQALFPALTERIWPLAGTDLFQKASRVYERRGSTGSPTSAPETS
jgi:short-subunit dehydrogenase